MGRKIDFRTNKQILIDEGWVYVRTDLDVNYMGKVSTEEFQLWRKENLFVYLNEARDLLTNKYVGDPKLKCCPGGYN